MRKKKMKRFFSLCMVLCMSVPAVPSYASNFNLTEDDSRCSLGLDINIPGLGDFEEEIFEQSKAVEIVTGSAINMEEKAGLSTTTISSAKMEVLVDTEFPRVISYKMISTNKSFEGQKDELKYITINGIDVKPVVSSSVSGNRVEYTMRAEDTSNRIDAVITAELVVKNNTLEFNVTNIEDRKILKTLEIKNHNLVSVNSGQTGAVLDGANMSVNTHKNGDRSILVDSNLNVTAEANKGYMYAFVSNNNLSAGLWSNSENKVDSDWQRVTATSTGSAVKVVGLSSTYWTYQKDEDHRKEDGSIEYFDGTGVVLEAELPSTKVVITDDINQDGGIDWQDGAIAYRDIMNNPLGSEQVPDLVGYRISMNFGSQAQNPFLMTLDGVKKVYLNTDGLGQSILLKGYGSEGHDSGHLDYADIGKRIGGKKDMKTLLKKGKEYGATFGIHVNASETYPESKYFNEDILMKKADGTYSYGWNWIDQGININADYDLRHGRVDRWRDLFQELGGKDNDLDFIYVDVWGNGQSGDNGSWASRQLAKEITSHGWRVAGEWGYANEYDSTFQHWAADLTYGGYALKGINSTITQFIRNHQKDSWVGNYTSYGGAADAPLLGAYNMKDFEGWQGRSDYAAYIETLFNVNIPTKFVQHFKVTDWTDGTPVTMSDNGETYKWTPGMEAVLKEGNNTLTIKRDSGDFDNEKEKYRSRTMIYNGKTVYTGKEENAKYLIPWSWDEFGGVGAEKLYHWNTQGGASTWDVPDGWSGDVKVYSLSDLGKKDEKMVSILNGQITLNADKATPYVIYKVPTANKKITWSEGMHLTDVGFNGGTLAPWTIIGSNGKDTVIENSQGSNAMLKIADNKEKVHVSQKLTDLKTNTKYAVYVGVDNRSIHHANLEITGAKKNGNNNTGISIARNYVSAYAHNTNKEIATVDNTSYFQNMYVFFETGDDVSNVSLSLSKDPGAGAVYFDDIRVCENNSTNWEKWDTESIFEQNFETNAQGIYPFVVGNLEGVTDNRTHLAQLHSPYTQRGWNGKEINDVIGGEWSIKTNGLSQRNNLVYQTIPQNFKLEPGVSYMISFDYEAGSDGTYAFVTGDGDYLSNGTTQEIGLKSSGNSDAAVGKAQTFTYNVVGPQSGLGWFGIYSTNVSADTKGISGGQATFNGYNDFILDNLVIVKSESTKEKLYDLILIGKDKIEAFYTEDSYSTLKNALETGEEVYNKMKATQGEVDKAVSALKTALDHLKELVVTKNILHTLIDHCNGYKKTDYSKDGWLAFSVVLNHAKAALIETSFNQQLLQKVYKDLILAEMDLLKDKGPDSQTEGKDISIDNIAEVRAGSEQPGEGAQNAVDNKVDTLWHSSWGTTPQEKLWFEFVLKVPQNVDGLRYLPRQSADNGMLKMLVI